MEARKTTMALISTGIAEPLLIMGHTGFPGILAGLAIGAGVYYLMDDEAPLVGGKPPTTSAIPVRSGSKQGGSEKFRTLLYGKRREDEMPTDADVARHMKTHRLSDDSDGELDD